MGFDFYGDEDDIEQVPGKRKRKPGLLGTDDYDYATPTNPTAAPDTDLSFRFDQGGGDPKLDYRPFLDAAQKGAISGADGLYSPEQKQKAAKLYRDLSGDGPLPSLGAVKAGIEQAFAADHPTTAHLFKSAVEPLAPNWAGQIGGNFLRQRALQALEGGVRHILADQRPYDYLRLTQSHIARHGEDPLDQPMFGPFAKRPGDGANLGIIGNPAAPAPTANPPSLLRKANWAGDNDGGVDNRVQDRTRNPIIAQDGSRNTEPRPAPVRTAPAPWLGEGDTADPSTPTTNRQDGGGITTGGNRKTVAALIAAHKLDPKLADLLPRILAANKDDDLAALYRDTYQATKGGPYEKYLLGVIDDNSRLPPGDPRRQKNIENVLSAGGMGPVAVAIIGGALLAPILSALAAGDAVASGTATLTGMASRLASSISRGGTSGSAPPILRSNAPAAAMTATDSLLGRALLGAITAAGVKAIQNNPIGFTPSPAMPPLPGFPDHGQRKPEPYINPIPELKKPEPPAGPPLLPPSTFQTPPFPASPPGTLDQGRPGNAPSTSPPIASSGDKGPRPGGRDISIEILPGLEDALLGPLLLFRGRPGNANTKKVTDIAISECLKVMREAVGDQEEVEHIGGGTQDGEGKGDRLKEKYIRPRGPNGEEIKGTTKGANYSDGYFHARFGEREYEIHINTVDMSSDGSGPTVREATNLDRVKHNFGGAANKLVDWIAKRFLDTNPEDEEKLRRETRDKCSALIEQAIANSVKPRP